MFEAGRRSVMFGSSDESEETGFRVCLDEETTEVTNFLLQNNVKIVTCLCCIQCSYYRALLCFNTFTKLKLEMIYFTELQQRNYFFPCQKNCENSGKRRKVYGMTLGESEVAHNGTLTKILLN